VPKKGRGFYWECRGTAHSGDSVFAFRAYTGCCRRTAAVLPSCVVNRTPKGCAGTRSEGMKASLLEGSKTRKSRRDPGLEDASAPENRMGVPWKRKGDYSGRRTLSRLIFAPTDCLGPRHPPAWSTDPTNQPCSRLRLPGLPELYRTRFPGHRRGMSGYGSRDDRRS
jgi:hypothetical protein